MSEHRRKPPQPQGGGRAAARRGLTGSSSGRRAAPRGATGSPSASYGSGGEERPYGGRAEARKAAQRSTSGGGRRRAADGAGRGGYGGGGHRGGPGGPGGPNGPGRGGRGAEPPRKRIIDYPRAGKYGGARWVPSWKLVTGTFVGFLGSMMAVAGIAYAMVGVPKVDEAATAQNNVYKWADGTTMVATGGETNRQIIGYAQIPEEMRYAVISAENKTFETDKGVDPMGIGRALFNMAKGGDTQGGSTITQQYVKNARLGDQSQTLTRKFKELFISIKVGASVDKQEIMAGYLNTAYYGRGAYGIQAAAGAYFNKEAEDLDASECAFLAAVLKGATYYDPAGSESIDPAATPGANRKRATERWSWILGEMVKDGHLSAADGAKYKKQGFPKTQSPRLNTALRGQIGYLVGVAKSYILKNTDITQDRLDRGGFEIQTTFDKKMVDQLDDSVTKVYRANIKPKERPKTDTHVQFGGASVDPGTGAIKAIYGGEDWTKHFTNNADQTGAQVGSTFKPFVLASAMQWGVRNPDGNEIQAQNERTVVSPKSLYSGKNKLKIENYDGNVWQDKEGKEWLQTNDGGESYNAPSYQIDLREAMRVSANSAYVQLGMDVGLDKVREAAIKAGVLEGSLASANYPSFSLGTSDPSAIRMAGAYATFAASGKQNDPYSVTEIEDADGIVFRHADAAKTRTAFAPEVADNVTDVLKTVVEDGTGTAAALDGRDVAGKTGTTDGNKSAWFVGYTPQLSTAISMYRMDDDANNKKRAFLEMYGTGGQKKIHGASFPAEIWHDYMEDALKRKPAEEFPTPEPIGKVVNDIPTPTPTPTPSLPEPEPKKESPTPSPTPSEPTVSPLPSPPNTCDPSDFECNNTGGGGKGGADNGGVDGGVSPSPPESDPPGNNGGNDNGGLFGGGTG